MGCNSSGQLGLNEPYTKFKSSPMLVDFFLNVKLTFISCGAFHTVALTSKGEAYAWGLNQFG